jgi:hypothetical protein
MITFGAGKLLCVPLLDSTGAAVTNPTPVQLGVLQDVAVDLSFETKMLYGEKQFPVAVGRGKGKLGFKAKIGKIDGKVLGSLFFGLASSAAQRAAVVDFAATVPGSPYQVTVSPPGSGTFVADLGVYNAATGVQLTRVASAPATGQYSVAAGVYTFAAADTTNGVLINYEYTAAAGGESFVMTNQLMGYSPTFSALLYAPYQGKKLVLKFNSCISSKLALPLKNDDFMVPDFDADAFADAAGNLGYMCLA